MQWYWTENRISMYFQKMERTHEHFPECGLHRRHARVFEPVDSSLEEWRVILHPGGDQSVEMFDADTA